MSAVESRHWRKPLKSGGVEFFFRNSDGETMRGQTDPPSHADKMQDFFETSTGCRLPEPELKEARS